MKITVRCRQCSQRGYVDTVIDPQDTRKYVIGAFEMYIRKEKCRYQKHNAF